MFGTPVKSDPFDSEIFQNFAEENQIKKYNIFAESVD